MGIKGEVARRPKILKETIEAYEKLGLLKLRATVVSNKKWRQV